MLDIQVKHPTLQFTKEDVEEILGQFNRTLDDVQVDIDTIKNWIESQPHLTHMPENRIIFSLLIRNKFAIEKTKRKLDNFYSIRAKVPELFTISLPSNKQMIALKQNIRCFTLPNLVNLNRIIFFVMETSDQKLDGYELMAKFLLDGEGMVYRDIHKSLDCICDFGKSTLAFWSAFNLTMIKIIISMAEKVYSNRCQTVRLIGLPSMAQAFMNSVIACLPQKIKERISFHSSGQELGEYYPKNQLPREYGGTTGRSYLEMCDEFEDMIDQCDEYFQIIQNYKVDESLRPMKLDDDEMLGYHGNFRKLEVD